MSKPKAEFVHSVFESIAHEYDKMNTIISLGQHSRWRRVTMREMGITEGQAAIDLCCGTCDWTISLAETVGGQGRVIGLDFSKNMLSIGQTKINHRQLDRTIELVHGDAMAIPYEDNQFDYATIGFALRNVPNFKQVLAEMKRIVKPGGFVVSLEASKPPNRWYRKIYFIYFYHILPIIAKMIVNKYKEYHWLPTSLTNFPDSVELKKIMLEIGFRSVRVKLFAGGAAALHIAQK
jgi:demethylmenaquinone methyltransferase/2-methoxy-6-polyprenyl-1,4-benzoquinol methylase